VILKALGPQVEKEGKTTKDDETSNGQSLNPFLFLHNVYLFNGTGVKLSEWIK